MITVQEATKIILDNTLDFGTETIPLAEATGRLLQENLVADRDFPPFPRVTMDGIAIRYSSYAVGRRSFPVEGLQAAGSPRIALKDTGHCVEVMTGAVLPENADTVIRYEDLEIHNGHARILTETVRQKQNVHQQGKDRKREDCIVPAGRLISAPEIGVAATVGKSMIKVAGLPRVAILSTGDELVPVEEAPLPHQIRSSNVHTITSGFEGWKMTIDHLHLQDDLEKTRNKLAECLDRYDVIILSGGVSEGRFDYVPEALNDLGVQKLFHRIRQRPGKPFWFGRSPAGAIVFALPGNPVSSFMCSVRYLNPWLRKCYGLPPLDYAFAELSEDFSFKPDLTYFLQVKMSCDPSGKLLAKPVEGHGSGDLANLVDADAFMELPEGRDHFYKGEVYPILFYR